MPRDSSGNYTLPPGNPVVGGTLITAGWANPTMTDIGAELTNSLDRSGRGGMLAPFKFADGTVGAPGITWNAEPTSGIFRAGGNDMQAVIAGVPRMRWTASSVDVWDTGSSTWLPIVGPSGSTYALVGSPNTFTAVNTFTNAVIFTFVGSGNGSAIRVVSATPFIYWSETDAGVDNKDWDFGVNSGLMRWRLSNDAGTAKNIIAATRSVAALSVLDFGNATDNNAFNFLGTGITSMGGALSVTGAATVSGIATFSNASGNIVVRASGAAADQKHTLIRQSAAGQFTICSSTDAAPAVLVKALIDASRNATAWTNITFGNATDNPTFVFAGTGAISSAGSWTFTANASGVGIGTNFSAALPGFWLTETDQAADNQLWRVSVNVGNFNIASFDDARTTPKNAFDVDRLNNAITALAFGNATDNPTFAFLGTGVTSHGGVVRTADGTAALPAWSFTGNVDTGFFRSAANRFQISCQATPRVEFTELNRALSITAPTANAVGNVYMAFYESGAFVTRKGYIGFAGAADDIFTINSDENAVMVLNTNGTTRLTIGLTAITATLPFFAPDGAVGTPSYSFATENGLGMFRNGAGVLSFAVGGALLSSMSSAGLVLKNSVRLFTPDGTNAAPAVTFESDSNTGLYLISPDALGFAEGGAGFRIGYRNIPRSTTATTAAIGDVGKCIAITATIAIPVSVFAAGDALSIYNDSAGALTVTLAAGNLRLAGTTVTASPRTIAPRGMMTLWFNVGGATPDIVCSGPGVS